MHSNSEDSQCCLFSRLHWIIKQSITHEYKSHQPLWRENILERLREEKEFVQVAAGSKWQRWNKSSLSSFLEWANRQQSVRLHPALPYGPWTYACHPSATALRAVIAVVLWCGLCFKKKAQEWAQKWGVIFANKMIGRLGLCQKTRSDPLNMHVQWLDHNQIFLWSDHTQTAFMLSI